MVGNLPLLLPVLNVLLQPVDPVLELWMVCQKDGTQTNQCLSVNICLFHRLSSLYLKHYPMFRIVQVRKTEGHQSTQDHLNVL